MNKKILAIFIIAIGIFGVGVFFNSATPIVQTEEQNPSDVNIEYRGWVDVYKTEAVTGETKLIASKHNLLVNNGKDYIRQQIASGAAVASNSTKYISLSADATDPATMATSINIAAEIANTNGMGRASATYAANGTGAWNFTKVFTATGTESNIVKTGLNYGATASDGTLFAVLGFADTDMLVNDQLTVVWSISVS